MDSTSLTTSIRASINNTSGTYITSPVENFIKTDICILQYLANITAIDQTLVVVPENLWLFLGIIPFVSSWLKKKKKKKNLTLNEKTNEKSYSFATNPKISLSPQRIPALLLLVCQPANWFIVTAQTRLPKQVRYWQQIFPAMMPVTTMVRRCQMCNLHFRLVSDPHKLQL